jgi:hypothetical protein
MKAFSLTLALLLTGTLTGFSFDDDPVKEAMGYTHRYHSSNGNENFDQDYDNRPFKSDGGFHPVFDLIKVTVVHVVHKDDKHIQTLQLPAVHLVSGHRAMVRINDHRYRVAANVKPSGKVDVDLAYLYRGPFAEHSNLLTERKLTLQPKRTVAFQNGKDEFRITAEVFSRETNQWLHYQYNRWGGHYSEYID